MGLFGERKIHADCNSCGRRFWIEAKNVPRRLTCPYCGDTHYVTGLK